MWKSFIPPKLFFILWRILHSRLPTNDVLQSRGMLLWFPQAPYVLLPLMQNRRTTYLFVVRLLLVFGDGLVLCFGCRRHLWIWFKIYGILLIVAVSTLSFSIGGFWRLTIIFIHYGKLGINFRSKMSFPLLTLFGLRL